MIDFSRTIISNSSFVTLRQVMAHALCAVSVSVPSVCLTSSALPRIPPVTVVRLCRAQRGSLRRFGGERTEQWRWAEKEQSCKCLPWAICLFNAFSYQIISPVIYCFFLWQKRFTFPFTFIIRKRIPENWYIY